MRAWLFVCSFSGILINVCILMDKYNPIQAVRDNRPLILRPSFIRSHSCDCIPPIHVLPACPKSLSLLSVQRRTEMWTSTIRLFHNINNNNNNTLLSHTYVRTLYLLRVAIEHPLYRIALDLHTVSSFHRVNFCVNLL